MSIEEMIEILDDPNRKLGWNGQPVGPEWEGKPREWAFGLFARWDTERQVRHLINIGPEGAADLLSMADERDLEDFLPHLPEDFRNQVEALLPIRSA